MRSYRELTAPAAAFGRSAACSVLQLNEAQTCSRDHCLELGVHAKLLDHVADVPLPGVMRYPQTHGHRCCVEALGQQPQYIAFPRRELVRPLAASLPVADQISLPRKRLGEERDRDRDLAG